MTRTERMAQARALLEPLVRKMIPDVRSAMIITRSLFKAYYNLHYIGDDVSFSEALASLKAQGVLYGEVLEALREICRSIDGSNHPYGFLRCLNVLQDSLPDHLVGEDGKIVWVADKPSRSPPLPAQPSSAVDPLPEVPESDPLSLGAK